MLLITCKQGGEHVYVAPHDAIRDVHVRLDDICSHCTDGSRHHHGEAAAACPRTHKGPCWQGPASGPKPDGCTVCRPLVIEAMPGLMVMQAV